MKKEWTLVTGGAKGLGADICRYLSKQGFAIALQYNTSHKEAEEIKAQCKSEGTICEIIQGSFDTAVTTKDFIDRYTKQFPTTKYLIYNVGNYLMSSLQNTSFENCHALFQTNVLAAFAIIHALTPSITKSSGSIITIGRTGLHADRSDSHSPVYTATKKALYSLTKSFAKELAPHHVSVNMVSPGYLERSVDMPSDPSKIPMGRTGKGVEIASLIAFLLDDKNRYVTGQNIEVAGGVGL